VFLRPRRGIVRDVPVLCEADWLGFVLDDLAQLRARAADVTRYVRLADVGAGGGGGLLAAVTTRRQYDGEGNVEQVSRSLNHFDRSASSIRPVSRDSELSPGDDDGWFRIRPFVSFF
jgi:hypothetical protein